MPEGFLRAPVRMLAAYLADAGRRERCVGDDLRGTSRGFGPRGRSATGNTLFVSLARERRRGLVSTDVVYEDSKSGRLEMR